jgi:cytoskeletal protein RodZ
MSREERAQAKLAMTMADERHVDFGTFLRQAREQRGLSLQQLAVTTKISARVLDALEHNDPGKLPGGIFSRSFVRAYAREVGLDPEAAVASFVAAFPAEAGADDMPSATSAVEAETFESRRRVVRGLLRLLGVVALVALVGFLYYWSVRRNAPAPLADPAAPSSTQAAGSAGRREAAAAPQPSPTAGAAPEQPVAPGPTQAPPATEPAPPAAAAAAEQAGPPPVAAPLVVALTVSEQCWLSVSVDGTRMPSRNYESGERVEYAVQRSITVTAGNAGAVAMTLNGKPGRPLGEAGQVVTTTINASAYEAFLR